MLENLNWWEIAGLLILALLIFGERLPKVIAEGLRMLRGLRAMAQNATTDLSRELGTDIQLQDLHPKAFIRKHLLSEDDEQAIRKPLQGLFDDVKSDLNGVRADLDDVAAAADIRSSRDHATPADATGPNATGPNATGSNATGPSAAGSNAADPDAPARPAARTIDLDAT